MRHWRLRKVFVIFPLSLYHKMMEPEFSCRASDSKSRILYSTPGFLLFLLASYFTMKGMEADLKHHFGFLSNTIFYGSDPESVTPIVVIPKKTLLCALQCHLSRWLECISNTIDFETKIGYIVLIAYVTSGKCIIFAFSGKVEMVWR